MLEMRFYSEEEYMIEASGYIEAAAGCGKTEAIVKSVGTFCKGPQLILTHTHAGVDALRYRFRKHAISPSKYHIDTIAGWAWGWVRKYPMNADYGGSTDIAEWNTVYDAMAKLIQKDFVQSVILNSYTGVIVDEYQDCTMPMHQLIKELKTILPCRVLGDPLQGIFGFRESLITWADVEREFITDLGKLETPHRWIEAGNESLGRWLLGTRGGFLQSREPDFRGSPIDKRVVSHQRLSSELISLTHERQGRITDLTIEMTESDKKDWVCEHYNGSWELWVDPVALYDDIQKLRSALKEVLRRVSDTPDDLRNEDGETDYYEFSQDGIAEYIEEALKTSEYPVKEEK